MSRYTLAKCKQCRRAGEKLFLKGERCYSPKCAITKRNYAPGQHGSNRRGRSSEFGLHLAEKQKLKRVYKLTEKQFRNTFMVSSRQPGVASDNFLANLEMRLDSIVFRLNWAPARDLARQLVTHGHITVNDKKVNIPSYRVRVGDRISIREESLKLTYFKSMAKELPKTEVKWLKSSSKNKQAEVISEPEVASLGYSIDMARIIEFYSR